MVFENIRVAAPSVLDEPDILWGMSDGLIYDFIFKNVTIGNETVTGIDHFMHNEYVFDKKPFIVWKVGLFLDAQLFIHLFLIE